MMMDMSRERELMAENKRLCGQIAGLRTSIGNRQVDAQMAQSVLDAAAAWYETQLHTPLPPKLRARTALILAIKDYKAYRKASE